MHKGLQIIEEANRTGLKFFPTAVTGQTVAVMQSDKVKKRDVSFGRFIFSCLALPITQHR